MDDAISLVDVRLTLGGYEALRGINVAFPQGTSTVIMGPSGCGKSTLLKVAAGLIPPDTGKVLLRGQDIFLLSERGIRDCASPTGSYSRTARSGRTRPCLRILPSPSRFIFRDFRAPTSRSASRAPWRGSAWRNRPRQRPAALSGGERKIASFLRALVTEPSLVFLDEPTLSIDFSMTEKISHMIHDLKARGSNDHRRDP